MKFRAGYDGQNESNLADGNAQGSISGKQFFTLSEFVNALGGAISESTVRRRIKDQTIPYVQPGGKSTKILIPASVLTKYQHPEHQGSTGMAPSTKPEKPPGTSNLHGPAPKWKRALKNKQHFTH